MIRAIEALELTKKYPYERDLKMIEDMIIFNCKLGKTEVSVPTSLLDKKHVDSIVNELQCKGYNVGVDIQSEDYGFGRFVLKIKWGY